MAARWKARKQRWWLLVAAAFGIVIWTLIAGVAVKLWEAFQ